MSSCSAVVLAGGRASRLGGVNKALLEIGGKRLLDRVLEALQPLVDQILVVGHLVGESQFPGVEILGDPYPAGGSLVGIHTGLAAARGQVALVVGCDMPFLSTPLLARILQLSQGHDLAVPRVGPHLEALHAAYRRSCLPAMEEAIARQQLKIIDVYPRLDTREVSEAEMRSLDPDLRSFFNINTPADLDRARSLDRRL